MVKPKHCELMWATGATPWEVLVDKEVLNLKRSLARGQSGCLAHQRERAERVQEGPKGSILSLRADELKT